MRALIVIMALGCSRARAPAPGSAEHLAAYLRTVAGADQATRTSEVASWVLDQSSFAHTVVPTYRPLWQDYLAANEAARPALVARLAATGEITARRHFAGDPGITPSQGRLRWAVPTLYPSMVAELGGKPIDTVFVFDGARWRTLAGLDDVVLARVRALDAGCGERLALAGPRGKCTEVGWAVADAALRDDREGFARMCALSSRLCGNASP